MGYVIRFGCYYVDENECVCTKDQARIFPSLYLANKYAKELRKSCPVIDIEVEEV